MGHQEERKENGESGMSLSNRRKGRRTVSARINADLRDELRMKFPAVNIPDLIQIAYDTSLLKLDAKLTKRRLTSAKTKKK